MKTQTQFSAITFKLTEDTYFVVYRGTDNTLVGWKEDFNMSFVCPVPAQTLAVEYLEMIAKQFDGKIIVGGHSKGGNLAVYAAAFCDPEIQERITMVYNYDGPGFTENVLAEEGYKRICGRIKTYVPQSSVVGMLLGHEEKYTIVHSSNPTMLLQHDTYTWDIRRNKFVYLETVTNSSKFIDSTLKGWMSSLDSARREKVVDTIYNILLQTKAKTIKDLSKNWLATSNKIVKSLITLDDDTRKIVLEAIGALVQCAANELFKK